jgi:hypothetical protein
MRRQRVKMRRNNQPGRMSDDNTRELEGHNGGQRYNQLVRCEAEARRVDEWQRRCDEK